MGNSGARITFCLRKKEGRKEGRRDEEQEGRKERREPSERGRRRRGREGGAGEGGNY